MSSTGTRSATVTITEARYVGAKIGTDLRVLNSLYGEPALAWIDKYTEEAALLLRDGYLGTVSYGFRDRTTNEWKRRIRYTATVGGYLTDSRAGSLPTTAPVGGYSFYSFLTYSSKFLGLTAGLRAGTWDRSDQRAPPVSTASSAPRRFPPIWRCSA